MNSFRIQTNTGTSEIIIGESIGNFRKYLHGNKPVIITDQRVNALYGKYWLDMPVITIGQGEKYKTLATVNRIYRQLLRNQIDRAAFLVGIGGGIVCDIAGFVASTYLRGIHFGFVPTTLLAQVDAAVGGKNGVNFEGYKNIIGNINQPGFILSDPRVLTTLPFEELSNGFAEIIKHALIADAGMVDYLETNSQAAFRLDKSFISHVVEHSVRIKSGIVNRDEKEKNERRVLNFGHTFGHAIEKVAGLPHGKAISVGMIIAACLSQEMGYLEAKDVARIMNLLTVYGLPVSGRFDQRRMINAIRKDKKRSDEQIGFVLLEKTGHAIIRDVPLEVLKNALLRLNP